MSLIIKQGKQDISQDRTFNPIVAKNVMLQIVEIKLDENYPDTLVLDMQVLDGEFKNRYVVDRISYDPESPYSWKYRSVRKAVGVPYSPDEPPNIDIEKILLNKALRVDLSTRKGKDKEGNEREYQNVSYKPMVIQAATSPTDAEKIKAIQMRAAVEKDVASIISPSSTVAVNKMTVPFPGPESDDDEVPW